MTNEQLRLRYLTAIGRHWRTSLDRSGPTPALIDDLAEIAEEYATEHARRVTARQQLRAEAAAPPLVAASPDDWDMKQANPAIGVTVSEAALKASMAADPAEKPATSSHRTRTRTRGDPK